MMNSNVEMSWRRFLWGVPQVLIAVFLMTAPGLTPEATAKGPGSKYCYKGTCHRVKTIAETVSLIGTQTTLSTSFYDDCKKDRFNPCGLTSSGEPFFPERPDNAASPIYPDGTVLMVRNPSNRKTAVIRVNNAGPYWGNRKLDVSRATAEKLGFKHRGVANLEVKIIGAPTAAEARYKKNRRYAPVPGFLGEYASLDDAQTEMVVKVALNAVRGALAPVATAVLATARPVVIARGPAPVMRTTPSGAQLTTTAALAESVTEAEAPTTKVASALPGDPAVYRQSSTDSAVSRSSCAAGTAASGECQAQETISLALAEAGFSRIGLPPRRCTQLVRTEIAAPERGRGIPDLKEQLSGLRGQCLASLPAIPAASADDPQAGPG